MSFFKWFTGALVALALATAASAQSPAGAIAGRIVDQTGAPLPGVTVTLRGVDAAQTFVTQPDGQYRFLDLAPGPIRSRRSSRASRPTCAIASSSTSASASSCR